MNATAKPSKPKRARRKPETVKIGNIAVKVYRRDKVHKVKDDAGNVVRKDLYRVWEVEDYTTGTRRFHSFSEHKEATDKATAIARQLSTGDVVAAQMRNADAASFGRAMELIRPTGASLEYAASVFAKCFEILGADRMVEAAQLLKRNDPDQLTRKTVSETVTELVALKEARKKSDRYVKDLKNRLERFAKDFAVDVHTVTTADVQRWLDRLDAAPQTVKNFRTVIGTLFGYAESRGYILKGSNPVESVESVEANGGAIEIYTPAEITELLKAASEDFLPFIALGAFAGLRSAEIERLEWKDIDTAGGFIHVAADKAKTRSRRLVPIAPNLAQWLAPYAQKQGKIWNLTSNDLQDARAATVEKSKTPWKDNGARHSFISYRLAEVQDVNKVALEAGNSPAVVFKHYRELVKPEQAKAWFAISPEVTNA